MKLSVLKQRALEAGIEPEKVGSVDDSDDPKEAIIGIILAAEEDQQPDGFTSENREALELLRAELSLMKLSALKRMAVEKGADADAIEQIDDSDEPKQAVISLLVEAAKVELLAAQSETNKKADSKFAHRMERERLLTELTPLKISALKKRAIVAGVDAAVLEQAGDEDSPKDAIIVVLLEHETSTNSDECAGGQRAVELRAELTKGPQKLSVLRKRAITSGASEEQLDEADDSDDAKAALIELVIQTETMALEVGGSGGGGAPKGADRPHFGSASSSSAAAAAGAKGELAAPANRGLHAMLVIAVGLVFRTAVACC